MKPQYHNGIVSRFVDYLSSGDPVAKLILVIGFGFFLFALLVGAAIVVIPIGAVVALIVYLYRHHKREKLKVIPNVIRPAQAPAPPSQAPEERGEYPKPADFVLNVIQQQVLKTAEASTDQYSVQELRVAFAEIAGRLYEDEHFYAPPEMPTTSDAIARARYLDQVEAYRAKTSDPANISIFLDTLCGAYLALRAHFPSFATYSGKAPGPSPLTVPLSITMDAAEAGALAAEFSADELIQRGLFQKLRTQIDANHAALVQAGIKEAGFDEFFAGTPLAEFAGTPLPVPLPDETRFAGMWVIAPQGMGKTTLLHDLIIEDSKKDPCVILMDSKGDLIEPFLKHKAIAHRRIIIGPDNPIGMNPLDIPRADINKAVDNLEYLFSSLLDFKLTAAQSMLLKAVLRSLITAFPKPTLGTFQEIMSDGPAKFADYIKKLEPDLQRFFRNEFSSENIRARRQEVLQRLRLLLDHELLRSMLLASSTTFRIGEAMDQGAFIIINNSRGRLGNKGAEFFGRFFIAQVLAAAQQRSFRKERDKKPCFFYIDEAHTVIAQDERITDILHECRSQKIALILAHQETTQVSDNVLSALQNCAIRFAAPDEEARKLAPTIRIEAKALQSMRRGQFGAYIRGLTKEGLVINVVKPDFSSMRAPASPHNQRPTIYAPPPATNGELSTNVNAPAPTMESGSVDSADKASRSLPPQLANELRKRFNAAPKLVQDAIQAPETQRYLRGIADANSLDEDGYGSLENEVMMALIGLQPVDQLEENLRANVPLPPNVGRTVAKEVALFVSHVFEQASSAPPRDEPGGNSDSPPPNTDSPSALKTDNTAAGDPGEPAARW